MVDADDFAGLTATYPEHPLSKVTPRVANKEALKQDRAQSYKEAMVRNTEANEAAVKAMRGSSLGKTYVRSEFLTEAPKFTSIKQINEQKRQDARKKCNLTNQIHD